MTKSIIVPKMYQNDPILKLLVDVLHLKWWSAFLLFAVIWIIDAPIASVLFGVFSARPGLISFLDDLPGQLVVILWSGGILLAYYVWSANAFSSLLWKLYKNGVVNIFEREINNTDIEVSEPTIAYFYNIWNKKYLIWVPVVLAIMWDVFVFIPMWYKPMQQQVGLYWWDSILGLRIYYHIRTIFFTYVIIRILIMEFLGIFSLRYLVRHELIKYTPFHPDNAGGLLPIGRNRLGFIYGLVCASFFYVYLLFQEHLGVTPVSPIVGSLNATDLFLYAVIMLIFPASFFLPLWSTHEYMAKMKLKLQIPITNSLFDTYIDQSSERTGNNKFEVLQHQIAALKKAPVWPYDVSILIRLLGTWSTLLLPILFRFMLESSTP